MKFHLSRTLSIASKVLVQVDSTRLSSRTSVYKRVATFDWKRGKGAVTTSRASLLLVFLEKKKIFFRFLNLEEKKEKRRMWTRL
jgi:hypothetical protein